MKNEDVRRIFAEKPRYCGLCKAMIGTKSGRFTNHEKKSALCEVDLADPFRKITLCPNSGKRPESVYA